MSTKRAPMTFDVEAAPRAQPKAALVAEATKPEAEARKKVGTSLPIGLYREAKARAALDEITIQEVIETALREFIARGKQ